MQDQEDILVSKRLQYMNVKDNGYKAPTILFLTGIAGFALFCIFYLYFIAVAFLLLAIVLAPVYYIVKRRHCQICSQKMIRFGYDTEIYFCCDTCQTKFQSAIGADNGSGD
jgi:hypothetical protein